MFVSLPFAPLRSGGSRHLRRFLSRRHHISLVAPLAIGVPILLWAVADGWLPPIRSLEAAVGSLQTTGGPPPLKLPWQDGQPWRTGVAGFHGSDDALDFLPPDSPLGLSVVCEGEPGWAPVESQYWVVAAAAGTVTKASESTVLIDHGNGWSTGYYHVHSFQVQPGDLVPPEWALGHPSTYGGCNTGPQVHFWLRGPSGETLRSVSISGRDSKGIGLNEVISDTTNLPPDSGTTPDPTPRPSIATKGDVDCDSDVDALDALKILRHTAGMSVIKAGSCPDIGNDVEVAHGTLGTTRKWGDVDCDNNVDAVDALLILRYDAGLPVPLPGGCAPPGG